MKTTSFILTLAASALLCKCAAGEARSLVLDTVGPIQPSVFVTNSVDGTLMVYSAYQANADFDSRDVYRPECSDYKIYTMDGKLLKRVHNVTNDLFQEPVRVVLPAGQYRVVARANGFGYVTVPVVIGTKQRTMVHLEGGWSGDHGLDQANAVHLPDGEIVGRKYLAAE